MVYEVLVKIFAGATFFFSAKEVGMLTTTHPPPPSLAAGAPLVFIVYYWPLKLSFSNNVMSSFYSRIDLSLVTFNWFLTAFVDSVPIEVCRITNNAMKLTGSNCLQLSFRANTFRVAAF